jgi:hypothetical protein
LLVSFRVLPEDALKLALAASLGRPALVMRPPEGPAGKARESKEPGLEPWVP